jgi:lipopolysaccharide/colanic/teichoic acid biosynthesis glycosyltransferase
MNCLDIRPVVLGTAADIWNLPWIRTMGAESVAAQTRQRTPTRTTDVEAAALRLQRPVARLALLMKRSLDIALASVMLVALVPLLLVVAVLFAVRHESWFERRVRLGRDGRTLGLARFRPLPGAMGRMLERTGARDVPLLFAVVTGRLSFVGPRPLPPGSGVGHAGPRRLMAPGLIGPAQRWARDPDMASALDDQYVARWSLRGDLRFMLPG